MLHRHDDHFVARAGVGAPVTLRDEVDAFWSCRA
jgi:hypothetical protein